jgi:hypothetical protein
VILDIIKIVLAVATALIGVVSLVFPKRVRGFTGLDVSTARGMTEIRSILGGTFIGLGIAPLILNDPAAYVMLGIVYLVTAAARAIGLVADGSGEMSNYVSLASEIVFGVLLIL